MKKDKMKKLFYATKNKYKIQNMKDRLKNLEIELITPYDVNINIDIEENGKTVIENAILKARAYYEKIKIPTIAGDSSLFVDKFDKQPGLMVRRVNGVYLDDEELENYYIEELNKVGGESEAFYITGLAIIKQDEVKTIEIKEDMFILKSNICKGVRSSDALGRLEFDPKINKYFCEMTEEEKELRNYIFDKECVNFIINNILKKGFKEMKKLDKISLIRLYENCKKEKPELSLDELLYEAFNKVKENENDSFEEFRKLLLNANGINEYEYYTKNVNPKIRDYIENEVFPQYEKNDKGHGILHILEVIRRSFALKDTLKLDLEDDIVYTVAACHDWGKYEEQKDGEKHAIIAARRFMNDKVLTSFFDGDKKIIVKEAIEDHSSSLDDMPRSTYGKLVSSADRNTRIEMVFIRSFFVGKARTPDMTIEEFLDFTFKRLSKRYGEERPENMFLEDETYRIFLKDMRNLLKNEEKFKNRYCEVNHIKSRENKVADELGETNYTIKTNKDEGR